MRLIDQIRAYLAIEIIGWALMMIPEEIEFVPAIKNLLTASTVLGGEEKGTDHA